MHASNNIPNDTPNMKRDIELPPSRNPTTATSGVVLTSRLVDDPGGWGSKGRHGWSKVDMFRIRVKHSGDLGYKTKMLSYPPTLSTQWLDLEGARGTEIFKKSSKTNIMENNC